MKKILTLVLFTIAITFSVHSQRFYSTVFDNLPQEKQVYPRNERNESYIPISGYIDIVGWKSVSVQVFREDVNIGHHRANLTYSGNIGSFKFNPITIKAELAEYSFKVFATNLKGDSIQIVHRQHIVSGDIYLIGGQSNAEAVYHDGLVRYQNKFARTFAGGYPFESVIGWQYSEYGNMRVGQLGAGLQKNIIENCKIPVCIINRAVGGIGIGASAIRNANNLADQSNNYGLTYFILQQAGLLNGGIKAFIWRQGENESSGAAAYWPEGFDKLYKYWHQDYPKINKYYVFQVGLLASPEVNAGLLRDYQRRTKVIYPDVDNIACVGTTGYDGIHYDTVGHAQTARELFRMLNRDFYGGKYSESVNSPNIQHAYFSNADKTELTLEFEKDQQMVWVEDTTLINKQGKAQKQYMNNNFYFDGNSLNTLVKEGKAVGNKVILSLYQSPPNDKFNYLPSYHDDQMFSVFGGPFLKNKIGMRAFSFNQVTIEDYTPPLSTPTISLKNVSYKSVKITWGAVKNAKTYLIERKTANGDYQKIVELSNVSTEYTDETVSDNTLYFYRVKAVTERTSSEYAVAQTTTIAKLKTPELTENLLSYKSLIITWKAVQNATSYILERKTSTSTYQEIAKLDSTKNEYSDNTLQENTVYDYRLKAFGINTESDYATLKVTTATKLNTPTISTEVLSYKSIKITWQAILNASEYILERKSLLNDTYTVIASKVTGTEYTDDNLQDNTAYTYRLKVVGFKTESDYATTQATTASVLGFEEEIGMNVFSLFPNPSKNQVTVRFKNITHGTLSIRNLGGQTIFEEEIKNTQEKNIPLHQYAKGLYLVIIKNENGSLMKKLIIE